MLRPSINEILKNRHDSYAFVVAIAKRAREIAIFAEEQQDILESKPVQLAVEELGGSEIAISQSGQNDARAN
jgi:DNA-directed RNA polymerase subunit omega